MKAVISRHLAMASRLLAFLLFVPCIYSVPVPLRPAAFAQETQETLVAHDASTAAESEAAGCQTGSCFGAFFLGAMMPFDGSAAGTSSKNAQTLELLRQRFASLSNSLGQMPNLPQMNQEIQLPVLKAAAEDEKQI
ncbi:MAG: hypothetical protein A2Z83_07435 [Omnitrophica bacterium GWA2_52_8]|nr:MAG: hypothetical protein A2Z83_07435 [Omnitrophica bacterium GWA2_52_8]